LLKDGLCPWYYNSFIVNDNQDTFAFQFTHTFLRGSDDYISPYVSKIEPLIHKVNPSSIFKIKANLGGRTPTNEEGGYHTDFSFDCKTAVYYVNTNNGYTLFKDGTKIDSIENRFVVFDSSMEHTGVSQTDTKVRCLINLNYVL
jgi:hypothetical protein